MAPALIKTLIAGKNRPNSSLMRILMNAQKSGNASVRGVKIKRKTEDGGLPPLQQQPVFV